MCLRTRLNEGYLLLMCLDELLFIWLWGLYNIGKDMENKMKKKDYMYCGLNILITTIIMIAVTKFGQNLYGSTVDWNTQHYSIPEYFRMRLYETGQFFPNFEMNLGAGQNIYNFSYYGLFSPIIWISYLLPFVSMRTYIMVVSVLIVDISIYLVYVWLKKRYSTKVCTIATFFFAMSSPLTFHSHRHIMFMNYMPFLILALMGIDRYFEKKKKCLLIVSACCMVLTSYFFSVCGMFVIGFYSIYCYLERNKKFIFKDFCKKIGSVVMYLMVSIMMSGILIMPTFATLTKGREQTNIKVSLKDLLIPNFNYDFVLYKNYCMGLTVIFVMGLIYSIYVKRKSDRFLGIVFASIIFFPFIIYIFNATMYVEPKVLIPFIPLAIIVIAQYLKEILEVKECNIKTLTTIQVVVIVISIFFTMAANKDFIKALVFDMSVTLVALIVAYYFNKEKVLIITCMVVALIACLVSNFTDSFDKNDKLRDDINNDVKKATDYIADLQKDTSYRTFIDSNRTFNFNSVYNPKIYTTGMYSSICDKGYNEFYFQKFGVENPHRNAAIVSWGKNTMFNTFMANRYFISDSCNMNGYKEKKRFSDQVCVYENEDVCPIGYASSNLMSKKQFDKLKYPYSNEALLKYVIVDKDIDDVDFKKKIKEVKDFTLEKQDDMLQAKKLKDANGYRIKVVRPKERDYKCAEDIYSNVKLKFKDELKDKVLIVRFDVDNNIAKYTYKKSEGDVLIEVNDVMNKITTPTWKYYNRNEAFEFVLSDKSYKECNLSLGFGEYNITNFKVYTLDYDDLKNVKKDVDEFYISDIIKDTIKGNINVKNDGYFRLSIPYDDGFKIQVDGKNVSYEKVDETFIGFPIEKGEHKINITYTAKFSLLGKILSIIGVLSLIGIFIYEKGILKTLKRWYTKRGSIG